MEVTGHPAPQPVTDQEDLQKRKGAGCGFAAASWARQLWPKAKPPQDNPNGGLLKAHFFSMFINYFLLSEIVNNFLSAE